MSEGYLYCFSNISMLGILKIGMTNRTPDIRLSEANTSDTWRPPTPYKIEFAKKEDEIISNSILLKKRSMPLECEFLVNECENMIEFGSVAKRY